MFAYVKYIADNTNSIVPISYIQNFEQAKWSTRIPYNIYWSPVDGEEPPSSGGSEGTEGGFYKGLVLKVSDSEKDMEEELTKSRARCPTTKLLEEAIEEKPAVHKKQDTKKILQQKGLAHNLENILKLNKARKRQRQEKNQSLFEKEKKEDKEEDNSCSSLDDSEDDVIPKKLHCDLETKYDKLKKLLKEEQSKYEALKKKYKLAQTKIDTLSELNLKYQKQFFASIEKMPTTKNETRTKETSSSLPPLHETSLVYETNHQSTSKSFSSPPKTTSSSPPKRSSPPIPSLEASSSIENHSAERNGSEEVNFDFHISKEKLDLARMVKKGKAGDSLYAKNLLSLFWEPEVLENRSVTGRKANSVKDAVPKPRLTPKKLDELKRLFKERMFEDDPAVTPVEVELRCASINHYVSQKIATLNLKTN